MSDFIDSNLILRYLLDDPNADKVERLLKGKQSLLLTDVTISEIVWVLESFYKWDRTNIVDAVVGLLNIDIIYADKDLFLSVLKIYKTYKVDFIDAYLAGNLLRDGNGSIYSFDRDFDKIPKVIRKEPK